MDSEAVEYVLCELRSGDVGDGKPGAAALARQHRAVDVLRPGLAEDVELRQVTRVGDPDALLSRRQRLLPGADVGVVRDQAFQLRVERAGKQWVGSADGEHRRPIQRHPQTTSQDAPL